MKTEHRFAEALKNMMSEMPLEEISVAALTRRCRVNRQTFYYHFHDIYDLLALVFLNETIPGIDSVNHSEEMATAIFDYYLKNERFIDETLNSAGKVSTHKSKTLSGLLACFCFENDENMRKEIIDLLDYRWRTNKA